MQYKIRRVTQLIQEVGGEAMDTWLPFPSEDLVWRLNILDRNKLK